MRKGIQFLAFLVLVGACAHRQATLTKIANGADTVAVIIQKWKMAHDALVIFAGAVRLTADALARFWPEKATVPGAGQ